MRFQVVVDGDFLADHGLAFGDGAGVGGLADAQNGEAGIGGGGAPMDLPAGLDDVGLVFLQVEVEMRQRVVLDVARDVAELLELRQIFHRRGAPGDETGPGAGERLLQPGIVQGAAGVALEVRGVHGLHGGGFSFAPPM